MHVYMDSISDAFENNVLTQLLIFEIILHLIHYLT